MNQHPMRTAYVISLREGQLRLCSSPDLVIDDFKFENIKFGSILGIYIKKTTSIIGETLSAISAQLFNFTWSRAWSWATPSTK